MMSRRLIIAANWKMNKGPAETGEFLSAFLPEAEALTASCDVVVAAPFVSLPAAAAALENSAVALSAENASEYDNGAYTGEVSVAMLKEVGVKHVILGHSERRSIYRETDAVINAKMKKVLEAGLKPIFCIGETLEERESGKLEEVLRTQVSGGLKDITEADLLESVLAYEPVWAIGTGVTASPQQAQDAHAFVRSVLADLYGAEVAAQIRIQYGGSVKPDNSAELMGQEDIDGALVGGAALDPQSFLGLIKNGSGA
jgi:triosephosphate isomerase